MGIFFNSVNGEINYFSRL